MHGIWDCILNARVLFAQLCCQTVGSFSTPSNNGQVIGPLGIPGNDDDDDDDDDWCKYNA
jgi:hypothetical protein